MKNVIDIIELKKISSKKKIEAYACEFNEKTDKFEMHVGAEYQTKIDIPKSQKISNAKVEARFTSARVNDMAEAKLTMTVTAFRKGVRLKTINTTAKPCFCYKNIGSHKIELELQNGKIGTLSLVDVDNIEVKIKLVSKNFQECVCLMKSSIKLTVTED